MAKRRKAETTGRAAASAAGRVLSGKGTKKDARIAAASALTQAKDRPKKKKKKKKKQTRARGA